MIFHFPKDFTAGHFRDQHFRNLPARKETKALHSQRFAIGRKRQAQALTGLPLKLAQLLAAGDIPHPDHAVPSTGGQELSIGGKGQSQDVIVSFEITEHLSGNLIPQAQISVELGMGSQIFCVCR